MDLLNLPSKDSFTESEAADLLGISLFRLHEILDQHIFNQGTPRPADIEFTASDLLLINVWNKEEKKPTARRATLLTLPKRK
jgi:hypothetical protein